MGTAKDNIGEFTFGVNAPRTNIINGAIIIEEGRPLTLKLVKSYTSAASPTGPENDITYANSKN